MSNRRLPMQQTDIKRFTKEQNILNCFRNALNEVDERTKRNTLPEILRLAAIAQVDGYRLLHEALSEKYSQPMPVDYQSLSMIHPLPSTLMQNLAGQSTVSTQEASTLEASTQGEFKCPNCEVVFKSAKGLQGHGLKRCIAANGKKA